MPPWARAGQPLAPAANAVIELTPPPPPPPPLAALKADEEAELLLRRGADVMEELLVDGDTGLEKALLSCPSPPSSSFSCNCECRCL